MLRPMSNSPITSARISQPRFAGAKGKSVSENTKAALNALPDHFKFVTGSFEAKTSTGKRAFMLEKFEDGKTWMYFPINYRPEAMNVSHEISKDGGVEFRTGPASGITPDDAAQVLDAYFNRQSDWETKLPKTLFNGSNTAVVSNKIFKGFVESNEHQQILRTSENPVDHTASVTYRLPSGEERTDHYKYNRKVEPEGTKISIPAPAVEPTVTPAPAPITTNRPGTIANTLSFLLNNPGGAQIPNKLLDQFKAVPVGTLKSFEGAGTVEHKKTGDFEVKPLYSGFRGGLPEATRGIGELVIQLGSNGAVVNGEFRSETGSKTKMEKEACVKLIEQNFARYLN